MGLKRFNEIMREVGAREVPDPEAEEVEEKRKRRKRKVEVEEEAETREVVLCEGVTAIYDAASGTAFASVPVSELSERARIIRFNEIMEAVGGRPVPVPAETRS